MHPDAGGKTEEFVAFSQAVENVAKAFRKRGIQREFAKPAARKIRIKLKRDQMSLRERERIRLKQRGYYATYFAKHREEINASARRRHKARKERGAASQ